MIFAYRDHGYIRFESGVTLDVLLELRMIDGALVIWGTARRDRFDARLTHRGVEVDGVLCDEFGERITITEHSIAFDGAASIVAGELPPETPLSAETAHGAMRRDG